MPVNDKPMPRRKPAPPPSPPQPPRRRTVRHGIRGTDFDIEIDEMFKKSDALFSEAGSLFDQVFGRVAPSPPAACRCSYCGSRAGEMSHCENCGAPVPK